jgi:acetyl esterase/lipase
MLRSVRVPVLFTHHFRAVDPASGLLIGAATDGQAEAARNRLAEAGVPVDYRSYETTGHSMHGDDPRLFVDTLLDWTAALPSAPTLR